MNADIDAFMHSSRLHLVRRRIELAWIERKHAVLAGSKGRGQSLVLLTLLFTALSVCVYSIHHFALPPQTILARKACPDQLLPPSNCSSQHQRQLHPEPEVKEVVIREPCQQEEPRKQQEQDAPQTTIVKHEPWYAENRTWHYPAEFPLCSMDVCFNFSRCEEQEELLVFSYALPSPPVRYFARINSSVHHTDDPAKACLFFVFLDTETPWPPHPAELPHWNGGLNHVLITFADMWRQKGPLPGTIGFASIMATDMHETTYRAGFDISIPLPGNVHMPHLQGLKPWERRYFMTFRGLRYLGHRGEGILRSEPVFRNMHNGEDVIVATSCNHFINDMNRAKDPALGAHCEEDNAVHAHFSYEELMNATFGLVPAGVQPNSYRFIEVLSAGAIPVLIADNYVKPFDTLFQWHRCILQFPSSQMHRILPTVRALKKQQLERRQARCLEFYTSLKDDDTLLRTAILALKARFYGIFHNEALPL